MNLNLKAATTAASIAALLALQVAPNAFASSTEWDDTNSDPVPVSSSPAPGAAIVPTKPTQPAPVAVSAAPIATQPNPVGVASALPTTIDLKAAPVSFMVPAPPSVSSYLSPMAGETGRNSI